MKEYYEFKYVESDMSDAYSPREISYKFYQDTITDILEHFKYYLLSLGFCEANVANIRYVDDDDSVRVEGVEHE